MNALMFFIIASLGIFLWPIVLYNVLEERRSTRK